MKQMSTRIWIKIILRMIAVTAILIGMVGCASLNQMQATYPYPTQPIENHTYKMPPRGNDIIGRTEIVRAKKGDTFDTMGERYDIGGRELLDANKRDNNYYIFKGSKILIPQEYILPPSQYRKGIVINIAELRLYYFGHDNTVMTFPVALGRRGWRTPLGRTYIFRKQKAPTWHVPKTIRDDFFKKTGKRHRVNIPPGPDNPLGNYAIYLHMKGYLIHGTNNPPSIGRMVSSGCIRMFNKDVAMLFKKVKRGTPVSIIYYPNKVGWRDGQLYLESHTPVDSHDDLYASKGVSGEQAIDEAIASRQLVELNTKRIVKTIDQHRGVPVVIGISQENPEQEGEQAKQSGHDKVTYQNKKATKKHEKHHHLSRNV